MAVSATSNNTVSPEETEDKVASCFGWLVLSGAIGVLAVTLANAACARWMAQDALQRRHLGTIGQLERIKRGDVHCLVQPEPDSIDALLADADCAANVSELYLGGDISDERLGRLRELPNLRSVVLLFADNADVFLERLQGMTTVEELDLEYTWPSRHGIEVIGSFPNLKSLTLPVMRRQLRDLNGIGRHPSLEHLAIDRIGCDSRLIPLLQSLPRLRSVTIEDAERDAGKFEESLHQALPNCECSVELGR
jgi:hypothetical protein